MICDDYLHLVEQEFDSLYTISLSFTSRSSITQVSFAICQDPKNASVMYFSLIFLNSAMNESSQSMFYQVGGFVAQTLNAAFILVRYLAAFAFVVQRIIVFNANMIFSSGQCCCD